MKSLAKFDGKCFSVLLWKHDFSGLLGVEKMLSVKLPAKLFLDSKSAKNSFGNAFKRVSSLFRSEFGLSCCSLSYTVCF
jgi:hypothetical protein